MKYLNIVKAVSEIILIWVILISGWMRWNATTECLKHNAPQSLVALDGRAWCVTLVDGTYFFAPLSILREKAEK